MVEGLRPYAPDVGTVIADKYVVDVVLAKGGMGVVVSATHLHLQQRVAIKFLTSDVAGNTLPRFLQEARAASRIQSDHVVRVLDFGTMPDGVPYMVMEYLQGRDLEDVLDTEGPRPVSEAVDYVLQAAEAVAEAHAAGLVHRDLKPANLFREQRKGGAFIKVLDFGISKDIALQEQPSLTSTGQSIGSPFYMSPEQVRDAKRVDHRTDIWALGVILYQLLTGQLPFAGETIGGVFAAIVSDPFVPLRELTAKLGREVPEPLEAAVHRCLARDVSKRFQTVGALARALAPFAPAARNSVDRIAHVEESGHSHVFGNSPTDPPPAQAVSKKSETMAAFGQTGSSRGRSRLALLGVGGALVVGVAMGAVIVGARAGGGSTAASASSPSPSPTSTVTAAAATATDVAAPSIAVPPPTVAATLAPETTPPPVTAPSTSKTPGAAPSRHASGPRPTATAAITKNSAFDDRK
jgi:serine/threonine-protein kinase